MPLGAQVDREHQSTGITPKMKSPLIAFPLLFSPSQWLQKTWLFISTGQCDLVWDNLMVSGSTSENVRSSWRAAAPCWRDPFPLTPELHHLVSKFFPLREWLKRGSQCNPAERTWQPVTPKHSLRGSGLSNAYIQSSWDCLASRLGHASEKHDDSGRRCFSGIKQMVPLLSSFFTSPQSLLRTSVHKCYHLFLSLPSWRRKGKVSLLQVLKKKYHQESSVLTWESLKSGLPTTFQ